MASTYSSLKIQLMATGENSGAWGSVTNVNLGTALEEAIVGSADVSFTNADVTLTLTDTNATQTARNLRLNLTGTIASPQSLIVPAIEKIYIINNGLSQTVTVKNSTGTGIAVPAGKTMYVYNNGTNVVDAITHLTSLTLGTALPVASGGTGSNTATFSGANITSLNASNISSGTLGVARGGTGATTLTAENVIIGNTTSAVKFVAPGTSGNVLTSNGSAWVSQAAAAGGGDYIMQAYTSPATWTKPAGLKAVRVTVIGGGGSAGNFSTPAFPADQKTGGGGGGTGIKYLDAPAIPGPVTVTVGSGGAASGPQVGNAGGTSSFGPLVSATGGGGGNNGGANRYIAGGTATNATVSVSGGVGAATAYNACGAVTGFIGGGTVLAQQSYGYQINTGLAANNYGGGGGSWTSGPGIGVAGAGGIVIVEEFY